LISIDGNPVEQLILVDAFSAVIADLIRKN